METPNFTDMLAEDLLTLIENAQKSLDQKIAAEKSDIEERRLKLQKLEARRAGKAKSRAGKAKTGKPPAAKPGVATGRPKSVSASKLAEQAKQVAHVATE